MIQRIVLIKLKPAFTSPEARAVIAADSRAALAAIPGVRSVTIGTPADAPSAQSWDLSVLIGFERVEDVPLYLEDAAHRAFADDYLAPRMDFIKAWNFEV